MTDVYIASSFSLIDRVEHVYDVLTDSGYGIPDVWWDDDQAEVQADLKGIDEPDEQWYRNDVVKRRARDHWNNIRQCDVFVLVAPHEGTKNFGGAHIELGFAFAYGLGAYSVGDLERSAMYISPDSEPITQVGSAERLVEKLTEDGYGTQ